MSPTAPPSASSSYLSAEFAVTLAVVAAGIGYGYFARSQQHHQAAGGGASSASGDRKPPIGQPSVSSSAKAGAGAASKKKKAAGKQSAKAAESTPQPQVVPFPAVLSVSTTSSIPGGFGGAEEGESDVAAVPQSKSTKGKKKKAQAKPVPTPGVETPRPPHIPDSTSAPALQQESDADADTSSAPLPTASQAQSKKRKNKGKKASAEQAAGDQQTGGHALEESMLGIETDSSWTHVAPKSKGSGKGKPTLDTAGSAPNPSTGLAPSTSSSSASASASATGESSPVDERREGPSEGHDQTEKRKTFAEKMLPKGRKTGVEDLLETPDHPTLARVMRIAPPPGEKPVEGYSWGDYEDVSGGDAGKEEGEGEGEGGWGVVKGRKSNRPTTAASTPSSSSIRPPGASTSGHGEKLSKTQRKNQKRKAELKDAKAGLDREQEARRARYLREVERERGRERGRVGEQVQSRNTKGGKVGGGMSAVVEDGRLVWE